MSFMWGALEPDLEDRDSFEDYVTSAKTSFPDPSLTFIKVWENFLSMVGSGSTWERFLPLIADFFSLN